MVYCINECMALLLSVLYLLVVLSCKIAEVGFGWWAAAMIGLIVITDDPPPAHTLPVSHEL